jgi:hypothetical protein
MHGWTVRTFPEHHVLEHRRTGSALNRPLSARVKEGKRFHSLGYTFLFFLCRSLYRVKEKPIFVGSCASLFGYLVSKMKREPAALPENVLVFLKTEQRNKLKRILLRS